MDKDYIQECLESYLSYIEKLPNGCQTIADYLREDAISEAMKMIGQFSEGMGWVVEMNQLLHQNKKTHLLAEENIYEYLHEINNGLEIQDFILVSDMFEYEMKPFFEEHMKTVLMNP